ncbi:MAG: D-alanine--D-alanine ligase [Eubacteriales bacterium]|jgi:D-alanine-D-alanine ligase|nr:D-alanine--D-alanine ligase [Eubacteriales bacterium]
MPKLKVAVIFGGSSSEHDVSRVSARNVINNLNREKYDVYTIGITKQGKWLYFNGSVEEIESGAWEKGDVCKAVLSPDATDRCFWIIKDDKTEKLPVDVVVPILHGKNGEDGTIQGLLQLAKIPYTGPGVLSSAMCMDKAMAKYILEAGGVPVAKWEVVRALDLENPSAVAEKIEGKFTYPVFVKPSSAGSSFGASKVNTKDELIPALRQALLHDKKALVEEAIVGREIECAVIGNNEALASVVGEIFTKNDFYDFEAKYTPGLSYTVVPADISEEKAERVREIAKKAYMLLECEGFSRVDFFVEEAGRIVLNEINTIPGFTDISLFPVMWEKTGIPTDKLLDKIIAYAIERN